MSSTGEAVAWPRVDVGSVAVHEGKLLLVKREGVWGVPRGPLALGERIPEAATRLAREQAGLQSRPVKRVTVEEHIQKNTRGETSTHIITVYYQVRPLSPPRESQARWVTLHQLEEANPKLRQVLNPLESQIRP